MNIILDGLPKAVKIDDAAVKINTDFRVCLKILQAFDDERLTDSEKLTVLVTLLYPDIPENTALAISQGLKFLNMGKEPDKSRGKFPQIYNFEKDAQYIFSAFKSSFNIDLSRIEYLHRWAFRSLFSDLGESFFNTLIGLRTRRNKGKLTKEEKEFVSEHSELIELEERRSKAAEDLISKIGRRSK